VRSNFPDDSVNRDKKKLIHRSESYQNLVNSKALQSNIELCEIFVIIGAHEETLSK